MTMCTITHAYLAVGIAGVAAFVLLLLCGQHHSLAAGELGGTEVSVPSSVRKLVGSPSSPAAAAAGPSSGAQQRVAATAIDSSFQ